MSELGLKKKELDGKVIFRGKGCSDCMGTGYRGRTGIYELLLVDDKIRTLILNNADSNTIKREGVKRGMSRLRTGGVMRRAALTRRTASDQISRGKTICYSVNTARKRDLPPIAHK